MNADRIRSGLLNENMIAERFAEPGVTEYMASNLLRMEVRPKDVAQAFLHQTLAERTTSGVTTVNGDNIAAALR